MKIKIFDQYYGHDLQDKINEFISDRENKVNIIHDIKFSTVWTGDEDKEVITSALIMYEEVKR